MPQVRAEVFRSVARISSGTDNAVNTIATATNLKCWQIGSSLSRIPPIGELIATQGRKQEKVNASTTPTYPPRKASFPQAADLLGFWLGRRVEPHLSQ